GAEGRDRTAGGRRGVGAEAGGGQSDVPAGAVGAVRPAVAGAGGVGGGGAALPDRRGGDLAGGPGDPTRPPRSGEARRPRPGRRVAAGGRPADRPGGGPGGA